MNKISGTIVLNNGKEFEFKAHSPKLAMKEAAKTLGIHSKAHSRLQKAGVQEIQWNKKRIYPDARQVRGSIRKSRQANRALHATFGRSQIDAGVRIHRQGFKVLKAA